MTRSCTRWWSTGKQRHFLWHHDHGVRQHRGEYYIHVVTSTPVGTWRGLLHPEWPKHLLFIPAQGTVGDRGDETRRLCVHPARLAHRSINTAHELIFVWTQPVLGYHATSLQRYAQARHATQRGVPVVTTPPRILPPIYLMAAPDWRAPSNSKRSHPRTPQHTRHMNPVGIHFGYWTQMWSDDPLSSCQSAAVRLRHPRNQRSQSRPHERRGTGHAPSGATAGLKLTYSIGMTADLDVSSEDAATRKKRHRLFAGLVARHEAAGRRHHGPDQLRCLAGEAFAGV